MTSWGGHKKTRPAGIGIIRTELKPKTRERVKKKNKKTKKKRGKRREATKPKRSPGEIGGR
jgi:hypothetical protein